MGFDAGRTGGPVKGELFAKLVERLGQLPDFVVPPGRHRFSGNVPRPMWLTWWTNSLTGDTTIRLYTACSAPVRLMP